MLKTLVPSQKRISAMAQILKLKDASAPWRKLIASLRTKPQEGLVKDEADQTVAVVLPVADYEGYKRYQQLRAAEADDAIFDEVAETMKGYDPDFIEGQIEQAVTAMKAEANAPQAS